MNTYDIKVKFYGEAFSGDIYDLKTVRLLDTKLQETFYQLRAIHLGQKNLVPELKSHIDHKVTINSGSFEFSCRFEQNFAEKFGIHDQGLFVDSDTTRLSDSVAKLFYAAMTLRRYVAEARLAGKHAKIIINTDPQKPAHSVIRTEKGNIVLNHPRILWAAQLTQESVDTIMKSIDGDLVTHFEFEGLSKPLCFTEESLIMLDQEGSELTATANFKGRLDHLFYSSNRGTVVSPHDIYQIAWDDEAKMKVSECANVENVEFITQPLISSSGSQNNLVIYKVVDCVASDLNHTTEQAC
jgi:hypothetical protein